MIRQTRLIRGARLIVPIAAVIIALIALGKHTFVLLIMLLESAAVAFVLEPLCRIFEKKLSRPLSALCAMGIVGIMAFTLIALCLPFIEMILSDTANLMRALNLPYEEIIASLNSHISEIAGGVSSAVSSAAGFFARAGADAVVVYFMLVGREGLLLRCELAVPQKCRTRAVIAATASAREIRMYVRGQITISACVGMLSAVGLFAVGVPCGIGIGLMAGVLNIIPYLGPVLACVPAVAAALSVSFTRAALALIVLISVQQIDGLILSPRVLGNATGFSPALVVIAIYIAGGAWGVGGMLAAMPLMIATRTCYRIFAL